MKLPLYGNFRNPRSCLSDFRRGGNDDIIKFNMHKTILSNEDDNILQYAKTSYLEVFELFIKFSNGQTQVDELIKIVNYDRPASTRPGSW